MASLSQIAAARRAPDRVLRIQRMAELFAERAETDGACQLSHLRAAGFTEAEAFAYADDARAILSGRPIDMASSAARAEAERLVRQARRIRRRIGRQER